MFSNQNEKNQMTSLKRPLGIICEKNGSPQTHDHNGKFFASYTPNLKSFF